MGGKGAAYLKQSLELISLQKLSGFEVVVADQSDDREILDLCSREWPMQILRVPAGDVARQASANTNAAINAASGDVVKVLFQDDFLNGDEALSKIVQSFDDPAVQWCLTGSEHSRDGISLIRPFVPRYHNRIQFGKNTVSSPSVLAFRRQNAPRFDENLIWLMDVDFYKQCELIWGPPYILPEPLAVNRLHEGQVSASVDRGLKRRELNYILGKYRSGMSFGDWIHFLRQLGKEYM